MKATQNIFIIVYIYVFSISISTHALSTPTNISPVASNFYRMVNRFKTYTNQDISGLENDRLQHLVLGGREALTEVKVINSFAVLYEDVLPVRFGGDILFNMLEKAINNAKKKQGSNDNVIDNVKENKASNVQAKSSTSKDVKLNIQSRKVIKDVLILFRDQQQQSSLSPSTSSLTCDGLFAEIDRNQDGTVTLEEFTDWILSVPMTASELQQQQEQNNNNISNINSASNTNNDFNDDNSNNKNIEVAVNTGKDTSSSINANTVIPTPQAIFQEIDTDNNGILSRDEFQIWTTLYLKNDNNEEAEEEDDDLEGCEINYDNVKSINGISADTRLEDIPLASERNKKHRERYLSMVRSFSIWGERINNNQNINHNNNNKENRMQVVIDGCFAGAKNTGVVKALGILYEDYMPLRVAGDMVFKLVEKAVG